MKQGNQSVKRGMTVQELKHILEALETTDIFIDNQYRNSLVKKFRKEFVQS